MPPTTLLTVPEAADHLRISRAMVYRLMERGELDFVKIGTRRLIPGDSIEAFIGVSRVTGSGAKA
jgi:excisionase family DNA binding protein